MGGFSQFIRSIESAYVAQLDDHHAECLAPIAGGQINSTMSKGRVITRLVNAWLMSWDQPVVSQ